MDALQLYSIQSDDIVPDGTDVKLREDTVTEETKPKALGGEREAHAASNWNRSSTQT